MSEDMQPLGVLPSWIILLPPGVPGPLSDRVQSLKISLGPSKCYREPTRDGHSDTLCSQLKVFIPASLDCWNSGIQDPSVELTV